MVLTEVPRTAVFPPQDGHDMDQVGKGIPLLVLERQGEDQCADRPVIVLLPVQVLQADGPGSSFYFPPGGRVKADGLVFPVYFQKPEFELARQQPVVDFLDQQGQIADDLRQLIGRAAIDGRKAGLRQRPGGQGNTGDFVGNGSALSELQDGFVPFRVQNGVHHRGFLGRL